MTGLLTVVCCTPDKPERRAHMSALCRAEGLAPVFTTDAGLFVHRDEPACTALAGAFPPNPAYKAHFLTYLAALRLFCDTGIPYALILEDDIVRCGKSSVAHIIHHAPIFDMLFLEYCAADCRAEKWERRSGGVTYVGGYKARCTGACVYSRDGAMRFLDFAVRDPRMIDDATLHYASTEWGIAHVAYVRPRIFRQDRATFADGVTGDEYRACIEEPDQVDETREDSTSPLVAVMIMITILVAVLLRFLRIKRNS
jgi:hypothetical protein